jgi:hypothetical protein
MTTFVTSCLAKDIQGETQVFYSGQKVRIHAPNAPQIDGAQGTVRSCFYQNTTYTPDGGMAVLLEEFSWSWCKDLEILPTARDLHK